MSEANETEYNQDDDRTLPSLSGTRVRVTNMIKRRRLLRNSILRLVIIHGVNNSFDIVFRCESTLAGQPSRCEKCIFDAIKISATWVTGLNINHKIFNWYDMDRLQTNSYGYPICLFHIYVRYPFHEHNLLAHLRTLCATVSCKANSEKLIFNLDDLFWIDGQAVWSQVIGLYNALNIIRFHTANAAPGFFERQQEFLLTYFKSEDIEKIGPLFAL